MKVIARLHNDFPDKFGLPRQSGLAESLLSTVVMEKEFAVPEAFRGIEGYERLWLLWLFDGQPADDAFSPTVRPPRLGGNRRMGVFATRSPNRPNGIGLTCVKLVKADLAAEGGPVLTVSGADMKDGTAIVDIKPYLPYADAWPDAAGGFAAAERETLDVRVDCPFPEEWDEMRRAALREILAQDPRPAYQSDPERVYRMRYAGYDAAFTVEGGTLVLREFVKEQEVHETDPGIPE